MTVLNLGIAVNAQEPVLTANQRREIVDRAAKELQSKYVVADLADRMAAFIRQRAGDGKYDDFSDPKHFAEVVTADLRSIANDLHMRLAYLQAPENSQGDPVRRLPKEPVGPVEKLAGNVGYIRIFRFNPRMHAGVAEAMKKLSGTDALIIDLRDNPGGTPDAAMYLAGFFFEKPTLVARIYSRPDNRTDEMWTAQVPGPLYLGKTIYILTSPRTFSAAEAFAYHLKHLGKAVIIGATSGGGAHRIMPVNLGYHFVLRLPITRPINVVTGGDWEGIGVVPDLAVDAEKALATAHLEAIRKLPITPERERETARLKQELGSGIR